MIRALWSAWRELKVFSRRKCTRRFPWFQYEMPYFVRTGTCCPFSSLPGTRYFIGSHELTVSKQSGHIPGTQHTTCTDPIVTTLPPTRRAGDTIICAALLWLVVFIGACRQYSTVCLTRYQNYVHTYIPRLMMTYLDCVRSSLSPVQQIVRTSIVYQKTYLQLLTAVCPPLHPR